MRIRYFNQKRKTERIASFAVGIIFATVIGLLLWIVLSADTNSPQEAWCIKQKHLVDNYPMEWTGTIEDICGDITNY